MMLDSEIICASLDNFAALQRALIVVVYPSSCVVYLLWSAGAASDG